MYMAFFILLSILSISSLLVNTPVANAALSSPEQTNFGLPESPAALAPATSPVAEPIDSVSNAPFGQQGELEQEQERRLEATVNNRELEQQQLHPTGAMEQGQDHYHHQQQQQLHPTGAMEQGQDHYQQQQQQDTDELQPIGTLGEQGQDQQQQQQALQGIVGGEAESLVDNTPFDSGSSTIRRGRQYCTWFVSTLSLIWLMILALPC